MAKKNNQNQNQNNNPWTISELDIEDEGQENIVILATMTQDDKIYQIYQVAPQSQIAKTLQAIKAQTFDPIAGKIDEIVLDDDDPKMDKEDLDVEIPDLDVEILASLPAEEEEEDFVIPRISDVFTHGIQPL